MFGDGLPVDDLVDADGLDAVSKQNSSLRRFEDPVRAHPTWCGASLLRSAPAPMVRFLTGPVFLLIS